MTRFIFSSSSPRTILGMSNGDDEVYLFHLRARAPEPACNLRLPPS